MFIVSIILVSISVIAVGVYYTGISTAYTTQTPNISGYNQMSRINETISEMNAKKNDQPETGGFAALGDFLAYGWSTMRVSLASLDYFNSIVTFGISSTDVLDSGGVNFTALIVQGIIAIVFIIFMFLIIQYWGGRNAL